MGLTSGGQSTSFQVPFFVIALYSTTMAFCHSSCFTASLKVEGSIKSCDTKVKFYLVMFELLVPDFFHSSGLIYFKHWISHLGSWFWLVWGSELSPLLKIGLIKIEVLLSFEVSKHGVSLSNENSKELCDEVCDGEEGKFDELSCYEEFQSISNQCCWLGWLCILIFSLSTSPEIIQTQFQVLKPILNLGQSLEWYLENLCAQPPLLLESLLLWVA